MTCAALLVITTGCGSPPRATDADKLFVSHMIPHHDLGMELIDIAATHADDVRLRRLVFEMSSYHHSDMAALSQWSFEWGVDRSQDFPGDLPVSTLNQLASLSGTTFDLAWLDAMIEHHKGAISIAHAVLSGDALPGVAAMAQATIDIQRREINEMTSLFRELCAPSLCT